MWDDARSLRRFANALFGISLALVLFGVAHVVVHLPLFPLRVVQLDKAPQQVDPEWIDAVVRSELKGTFFTADLEHLRASLEQLPWVRKVSVRRQFPGRLIVSVEEHVALARWSEDALVNTYGEVFPAKCDAAELPVFLGQPGKAAEMVQVYGELGEVLKPLQQRIVQITLSPRHQWRLRLESGLVLVLGREEIQQRLARFVAVYPYSLAAMPAMASYVDLRYGNGFAAYLPGMNEKTGARNSNGKV